MPSKITISVKNETGIPINQAGVSFTAYDLLGTGNVSFFPAIGGGTTGINGKFVGSAIVPTGFWAYTVTVTAQGYQQQQKVITVLPNGETSLDFALVVAPFSNNIIVQGLPELISVGNPPTINFSGLDFFPYASIETVLTTDDSTQTFKTPINSDGTAQVSLFDRIIIDAVPRLVPNSEVVLYDSGMAKSLTVVCSFVNDGYKQTLATYQTTAILVDYVEVSEMVFNWFPYSSISVEVGAYADAMILLPVGTYKIARVTNIEVMYPVAVTSDGTTPIRVRIPNVETGTQNMRLYATLNGNKISNDLTVTFR